MYFFTREEAGTACFIRTKCAPLLLRFCVLYRAYPLPQKDKTRKENPFRVQTPIPQRDTTPKRKKDIPRIFSGYYPYTKGVSLRRASLIFSYPEKIRDFSPDTTPNLFPDTTPKRYYPEGVLDNPKLLPKPFREKLFEGILPW